MADLPLTGAFTRANPLPFPRKAIEKRIELLIALLDEYDGDEDLEDGDEDCCPAFEDRLWSMGQLDDWTGGAGDPVDAEESEQLALAIRQ